MFDIGWTEILVIVSVAIIVVGPKDLPRMLRTVGQTIGKVRRMSREFQSTFNDAIREAEKQADIADMKKTVESVGNFNPLGDLKKSIEDDKLQKMEDPAPPKPLMPEEPVATADPAAPEAKSEEKPAASSKASASKSDTSKSDTSKPGGQSEKTEASASAEKTAEETKA